MSSLMIIQSQLLATKFYAPMSPGTLIKRSRLYALLNESLKSPLTLVSAPAGFGKTTLLSTWAHSLLSPENAAFRAIVAMGKSIAYYGSSLNDSMAAIECGYQATLLTREARQPVVTFSMIAITAFYLIGAGHLREVGQLIEEALLIQTPSSGPRLPEVGWIMIIQAEILRERNDLAAAFAKESKSPKRLPKRSRSRRLS
jgi:hypothetical protein